MARPTTRATGCCGAAGRWSPEGTPGSAGPSAWLAFAREGADVVFTHLPEEAGEAEETTRLIREAGRTGVAVACHIRHEGECTALVDKTVGELGGIDLLVNPTPSPPARSGPR